MSGDVHFSLSPGRIHLSVARELEEIKRCGSRNFCFLFCLSRRPSELSLIQSFLSNQKARQGEPLPFAVTAFLSYASRLCFPDTSVITITYLSPEVPLPFRRQHESAFLTVFSHPALLCSHCCAVVDYPY
jgi:hypothetical protein